MVVSTEWTSLDQLEKLREEYDQLAEMYVQAMTTDFVNRKEGEVSNQQIFNLEDKLYRTVQRSV